MDFTSNTSAMMKIEGGKPLDIVYFILYDRYGVERFNFSKRYTDYFAVHNYDEAEKLQQMGEIFFSTELKNVLPYSETYGKMFHSLGRFILGSIKDAAMFAYRDDWEKKYDRYDDYHVTGNATGLAIVANDIMYPIYKNLLRDFASDEDPTITSPALYITPYLNNGDAAGLNHAEFLPVMATGIYYTLLGSLIGVLGEDLFKLVFDHGKNSNGSHSETIEALTKNVTKEQFTSITVACGVFSNIVEHVEKSIGITFTDRFTRAFKGIGGEFTKTAKTGFGFTDTNEDSIFDYIMAEDNPIEHRLFATLLESLRPKSNCYVGDHSYDFRPMYLSQIMKSDTYSAPMYDFARDSNTDFTAIANYESVIDAHAYERMAKYSLTMAENILEDKYDEKDFYMFVFCEKMLSKSYTYWKNAKTPLRIDGVDDLYVEIKDIHNNVYKQAMDVNTIKYPDALKRVMDIIESINARYVEAMSYMYCKLAKSDFNDLGFKILDRVNDYQSYSSIEDAVRDFRSLKVPYAFSVAQFDERELKWYYSKIESYEKVLKLNYLDRGHVGVRSISRSPFDIVNSGDFNHNQESAVTKKFRSLISEISNSEYLYLFR